MINCLILIFIYVLLLIRDFTGNRNLLNSKDASVGTIGVLGITTISSEVNIGYVGRIDVNCTLKASLHCVILECINYDGT